ncbi:MAG: tetratricopeptide repeat protein [Planctomycetota bacterium]|nr:MAG: tetratricopeptide repeat protein [Planctomycetota bacterium]
MKAAYFRVYQWMVVGLIGIILPYSVWAQPRKEDELKKKLKRIQKKFRKLLEQNQRLKKQVQALRFHLENARRRLQTKPPRTLLRDIFRSFLHQISRLLKKSSHPALRKLHRTFQRLRAYLRKFPHPRPKMPSPSPLEKRVPSFPPILKKTKPSPKERNPIAAKQKAWLFYQQGLLRFRLKKYEEAIKYFNYAIKLQPGQANYYFARGNTYLSLKQFAKAKRDYLKTIVLDPQFSAAYYNIACIYALQKNKKEAIKWLTQAIYHGFQDYQHMRKDPDLRSLWGDPRFKRLLQKRWK